MPTPAQAPLDVGGRLLPEALTPGLYRNSDRHRPLTHNRRLCILGATLQSERSLHI